MTRLLLAMIVAIGAGAAAERVPDRRCADVSAWPHWERYREAFLSGDGRVIDRTSDDRTTSEGQAYALFHALVADDRATFERVLRWTEQNLAGNDLARQLPAWKWGKAADGTWHVLDPNSATDADLWIAYALLEAGRLWTEPRYEALARAVLASVVRSEVVELPALGPMLLPGPRGFALEGGRAWRLNPSYLAPPILQRFASAGVPGPWSALLRNARRVVRESAPRGAVPDWVLYRARDGFGRDPVSRGVGSYDAIRSYLWDAMSGAAPERAQAPTWLLERLARTGELPEKVDVKTLRSTGSAPVGFYAALLPEARTRGDVEAVRRIEQVLGAARKDGLYGSPPAYYDQNLALFGVGFAEGRFRFEHDGRLSPAWEAPCAARP